MSRLPYQSLLHLDLAIAKGDFSANNYLLTDTGIWPQSTSWRELKIEVERQFPGRKWVPIELLQPSISKPPKTDVFTKVKYEATGKV